MKNPIFNPMPNRLNTLCWFSISFLVVLLLSTITSASTIVQISGGGFHSLVLKSDGTVWAWGLNIHGQLGDGTNADRKTPVQVKDLGNVAAIAGGVWHSVALKTDGTVWV